MKMSLPDVIELAKAAYVEGDSEKESPAMASGEQAVLNLAVDACITLYLGYGMAPDELLGRLDREMQIEHGREFGEQGTVVKHVA